MNPPPGVGNRIELAVDRASRPTNYHQFDSNSELGCPPLGWTAHSSGTATVESTKRYDRFAKTPTLHNPIFIYFYNILLTTVLMTTCHGIRIKHILLDPTLFPTF